MNDQSGTPSLAYLPTSYRLVLCDLWGCIHNGVQVFPAAMELLEAWRLQGRVVLLVTNAPRPAQVVESQLDRLGLSEGSYDAVVTSGDTGIASLIDQGLTEVGFIGTAGDRVALAGTGLHLRAGPDGPDVVCTGMPTPDWDPVSQNEVLRGMRARGARLHCFNPDRVVVRGDTLEPCAGAVADRYESMGGEAIWYGKPYAPIYERCLATGSDRIGRKVSPTEVVAIGDSLSTDVAGAVEQGFAFVFVTHGVEADRVARLGVPGVMRAFSEERGLPLAEPLAVVRELA